MKVSCKMCGDYESCKHCQGTGVSSMGVEGSCSCHEGRCFYCEPLYLIKCVSRNKKVDSWCYDEPLPRYKAIPVFVKLSYRLRIDCNLKQDERTPTPFLWDDKWCYEQLIVYLSNADGDVELSTVEWKRPKLSKPQSELLMKLLEAGGRIEDVQVNTNTRNSLKRKGLITVSTKGGAFISRPVSYDCSLTADGRLAATIDEWRV